MYYPEESWDEMLLASPALAPAAPTSGIFWLHGRLLKLHELPWLSWAVFTVWCRVFRQPLPDFYDIRSGWPTRAGARSQVEDDHDYVVAGPWKRPLGSRVAEGRTFCRPLHADYEVMDEIDSVLYAAVDAETS